MTTKTNEANSADPLVANSKPFRDWECSKCGHEVMAVDRPEPIRWTDGHVCRFVEVERPTKNDA
jgi:hypothetical protein